MPWRPSAILLSEVIGALSYALDLTEGEPPGHAQRSCLIGMRLAARAAARPRDAVGPVLRAAAQGRRLHGERGADGGAVRRRRPRAQAQRQAHRLGAQAPRVRVVGARGRAEGVAEGQAGAAARDQGRGRGDALADAGALRSRRRDRAHDRPVGRHGGGDPGARRALGRPRPAALAARRADPAAGPHPVPGPDGGDLPRQGRGRRRLRGRHAALGHLVRPRAGAGARRLPAGRRLLGLAGRARPHPLGARGPGDHRRRRPRCCRSPPPSRRSSTPSRRGRTSTPTARA